jgi:hypothetical protein
MKKTSSYLFAAIALLSPLTSEAASISVSNINDSLGGTSFVLLTSTGSQLSTGFIAVYEFASGFVPSTSMDLKTNETTGFLGLAELSAGNRPNDGAVFASLDIEYTNINDLFVVIGNNTSVIDASEFALVKASDLTLVSGGGGAETLGTYELDSAPDVKVGTVGSGTFDYTVFGQPMYNSNSLSLVAVPEPSSALLLGLSLLAVAGNRRRK